MEHRPVDKVVREFDGRRDVARAVAVEQSLGERAVVVAFPLLDEPKRHTTQEQDPHWLALDAGKLGEARQRRARRAGEQREHVKVDSGSKRLKEHMAAKDQFELLELSRSWHGIV